jgi:hypothetical protein
MIDLETLVLKHGAHSTRKDGMCAEEAVAALAGLGHTDSPACASRVIAACMRRINDAGWSSDEARTAGLKRWLVPQIGTATDDAGLERRRAFAAADVAVREIAPRALDARGYAAQAAALRALRPIVDAETARATYAAAAYAATYAAARAADAAYYAAAAANAATAAAAAAYASGAAANAATAAAAAAYASGAAANAATAAAAAADDAADAAADQVLTWAAERLMSRMLGVV